MKKQERIYRTIHEFLEGHGVDSEAVNALRQMNRAIYTGTACGAWIRFYANAPCAAEDIELSLIHI